MVWEGICQEFWEPRSSRTIIEVNEVRPQLRLYTEAEFQPHSLWYFPCFDS